MKDEFSFKFDLNDIPELENEVAFEGQSDLEKEKGNWEIRLEIAPFEGTSASSTDSSQTTVHQWKKV